MNIRPKKSLGQHFLHSGHVLEQIIAAAEIKPGENILEIGPGTGVLTKALLGAGAKVVCIEKDTVAHNMLQITDFIDQAIRSGNLELIHGDVLELDPATLSSFSSLSSSAPFSYAIVANIPYYITGAILEKFLEYAPRPDRMVLLVQKEVAERIVARDGKESILSVSVKAFGEPSVIAKVPPGAFVPPPTVDSAILSIKNISDARFVQSGAQISRFFDIVRAGFAHKRKFAKKNLEAVATKEGIEKAWLASGLDDKIRAEDMPINAWFGLTKGLEDRK